MILKGASTALAMLTSPFLNLQPHRALDVRVGLWGMGGKKRERRNKDVYF